MDLPNRPPCWPHAESECYMLSLNGIAMALTGRAIPKTSAAFCAALFALRVRSVAVEMWASGANLHHENKGAGGPALTRRSSRSSEPDEQRNKQNGEPQIFAGHSAGAVPSPCADLADDRCSEENGRNDMFYHWVPPGSIKTDLTAAQMNASKTARCFGPALSSYYQMR